MQYEVEAIGLLDRVVAGSGGDVTEEHAPLSFLEEERNAERGLPAAPLDPRGRHRLGGAPGRGGPGPLQGERELFRVRPSVARRDAGSERRRRRGEDLGEILGMNWIAALAACAGERRVD